MRRSDFFGNATLTATLVGLAAFGGLLLGQAPTSPPGQAQQATAPAVPKPIEPPAPFVPEGFTAIFNGRDLTGWHISSTNHHGTTPAYRVMHGMIVGSQNPLGQGGILLTDKKYRNVEVYMEVRPDYGCDSGLFLRSTEAGEAYQVTLDYLPGGGMGGIYGERLTGVGGRGNAPGAGRGNAPGGERGTAPAPATPPPPPVVGGIPLGSTTPQGTAAWMKVWKREDWNSVRARFVGDVPHITVWINDQQITDFTDTANHAAGGITEGSIAIQVHGGTRWVPGGLWRWRTIAVRELPADAK
jgi:hypothetical protein